MFHHNHIQAKRVAFLLLDSVTTAGSLGGTGSVDWYNQEFNWTGGTIDVAGGLTIDGSADFKTTGADAKFLNTKITNTGAGIADFGGAGTLTLMGSGDLHNAANAVVVSLELSLPTIAGFASGGGTPDVLDNYGKIDIDSTGGGVNIGSTLYNEVGGILDCVTEADGAARLAAPTGGTYGSGCSLPPSSV